MTTEARRWLDDESADPALRELLLSAEVDEPSEAQVERLTARLAFLFPLPPGGGGGDGGGGLSSGSEVAQGPVPVDPTTAGASISAQASVQGAVATAATTGGVKAMVAAGVLAGGVIAGGVVLAPKSKPENSRPLPQVSVVAKTPVQETPKPVEVVAKVADEAPVVKAPPPKASPPTRRGPPTPESVAQVPPPSSVDAELAALDDAVAAARAGRPREALNVVEAHIAAFPQSLLAQEREVVAIEALVALGRVDDARDRLRAFRRRWPTSTHLVRLETLLPE